MEILGLSDESIKSATTSDNSLAPLIAYYDYKIMVKFNGSILKVVSATFVLVYFLSLNESTCQTRKNVVYFTSKALFVLEKIKF